MIKIVHQADALCTCRPLSSHFARNLGLSRDMVQELAELPGTKNMDDLRNRAQALSQWKISMQRGYLPEAGTLEWPATTFQSSFVNALENLGMPRFTRRYPKLLDSLLRQMMQLVHVGTQSSNGVCDCNHCRSTANALCANDCTTAALSTQTPFVPHLLALQPLLGMLTHCALIAQFLDHAILLARLAHFCSLSHQQMLHSLHHSAHNQTWETNDIDSSEQSQLLTVLDLLDCSAEPYNCLQFVPQQIVKPYGY